MPDDLPEAVTATLVRVDGFVTDTLEPADRALAEPDVDEGSIRTAVIAAARAADLFQLTRETAEPHTQLRLTAVLERLAATGLRSAAWALGPAPGLLGAARGATRERFLTPYLEGRLRTGFGFTEPADAPPTRAVLHEDAIEITGLKSYVTGGGEADLFLVVARAETASGDALGPLVVLVPRATAGCQVEAVFHSLDGSSHARLRLDGARVPADFRIGEPGEGMPRAMGQIADTRLAIAANATGTLLWLRDYLETELSRPRTQGTALAAREGVRLRFADLCIRGYAARSMLYRTARLADQRRGEGSDPARATLNEGMMTKVFATEAVGDMVDAAIQWVGGQALVAGHPLERQYRRVRAWRLAEGASDTLRLNIARGRFDHGAGTL